MQQQIKDQEWQALSDLPVDLRMAELGDRLANWLVFSGAVAVIVAWACGWLS